ncbi:unnamed protein product [Rotaria sp. Silwood2]|nr:unnamed protein product [Rotaria sp. Silwood2]CAF3342488.1 unnamed protein product [Rotaria sp. Silwood2]CAF3380376.1 unnamed protein product [Rotaria sp. Silwood2]CAF4353484.1 unnamed protein product [Rotaria sp. Silwood2]CAF4357362.1 unnamed protein product [Rotaria sp. Silwood2]
MPWKAIPYSDRDRSKQLSEKFDVEGIPTLVVLSADGKILTGDGCDDVLSKGAEAIRLWSTDDQKTTTSPKEYVWPGVSCKGCQVNPIMGQRYKCSTCDGYNLCSACQKNGHEHELTLVPQTLTTIETLVRKEINANP